MTRRLPDVEEGLVASHGRANPLQQAHTLVQSILNFDSIRWRRLFHPNSHSPVSNIPRTSPERLALAAPGSSDHGSSAPTVLYLAYGSNLSAKTFLETRKIQPISQINASAPEFDLVFDLPGLPYWEPCFSNVAPRKIPKPPIPIDPPKPPFPPPPPPPPYSAGSSPRSDVMGTAQVGEEEEEEEEQKKDPATLLPSLPPDTRPSWSKGLYGVVYEVTREDYAKIIRTEGVGYHDILTPCFALPPPIHVPEKPPIPELPKPFLVHTLYAPQIPSRNPPDGDGDDNNDGGGGGSNGRDGDDNRWWRKLLLPPRRADPDYSQPSPRYLGLLRDGAREHYLPDDYQAYLARLEAFRITTWRQEVGRWLLLLVVLPSFAPTVALRFVLADEDGRPPRWLTVAETVVVNLIWIVYDRVFKPVFGDGERTIEDDTSIRGYSTVRNTNVWGNEESALLADW